MSKMMSRQRHLLCWANKTANKIPTLDQEMIAVLRLNLQQLGFYLSEKLSRTKHLKELIAAYLIVRSFVWHC